MKGRHVSLQWIGGASLVMTVVLLLIGFGSSKAPEAVDKRMRPLRYDFAPIFMEPVSELPEEVMVYEGSLGARLCQSKAFA